MSTDRMGIKRPFLEAGDFERRLLDTPVPQSNYTVSGFETLNRISTENTNSNFFDSYNT